MTDPLILLCALSATITKFYLFNNTETPNHLEVEITVLDMQHAVEMTLSCPYSLIAIHRFDTMRCKRTSEFTTQCWYVWKTNYLYVCFFFFLMFAEKNMNDVKFLM